MALGHFILVIVYHVISQKTPYRDLGPNYFDQRDRLHVQHRLTKRLERLGYRVTLEPLTTAAGPTSIFSGGFLGRHVGWVQEAPSSSLRSGDRVLQAKLGCFLETPLVRARSQDGHTPPTAVCWRSVWQKLC
ncbi:MAG: hypothetical protein Q8O76_02600 [Chloroflexota bacterium]|nr:hypothetical protein [Chloroflexota bacterium]